MNSIRTFAAICLAASGLLGPTSAAPNQVSANDTCATPLVISGYGTWPFDNTGATTSGFLGGSSLCILSIFGTAIPNDEFYVWTAAATENVDIHTCGPYYTTSLAVHDGGDCNATCTFGNVFSSCDVFSGSSRITASVTAGDSYLIQVGGFQGGVGALPSELTIEPSGPAPVNDSCATPLAISGIGSFVYDQSNASSSGFYGGDLATCTQGIFYPPHNDVFLTWTVPADGRYLLTSCGRQPAAHINVHQGTDCSATCWLESSTGYCAGGTAGFVVLDGVQAGETYLLQIGSTGEHGDAQPGAVLEILPLTAPDHDTCATPRVIPGLGTYAFDSFGALSSGFDGGNPATCHSLSNPNNGALSGMVSDVFFTYTMPCNGFLQASAQTPIGNAPPRMSMHLGTDCSATCLSGSTDGINQTTATINNVALTSGQNVLIQVGNWFPQSTVSTDTLTLDILPTGGACATSIDIDCTPGSQHAFGGSVFLSGSPIAGSALQLEANGGPPNAFGFFLVSAAATVPVPMANVGQGVLCLTAPFGRFHPATAAAMGNPAMNSVGQFDASGVLQNLSGTSVSGTGFTVPFELPLLPGGQQVLSGDSWSYQLWYRDTGAGGAPAANLSDMLTATFR